MGLRELWHRWRRPGSRVGRWLTAWLGDEGERLAVRYLRSQGYRILARGYRTALGELDVIALDGNCVVFVEVKTRRTELAGHPVEAVDGEKQARLTRLALAFLKQARRLEQPSRFDVVAVVWGDERHRPEIVHYRNAFEAHGRGQMFS